MIKDGGCIEDINRMINALKAYLAGSSKGLHFDAKSVDYENSCEVELTLEPPASADDGPGKTATGRGKGGHPHNEYQDLIKKLLRTHWIRDKFGRYLQDTAAKALDPEQHLVWKWHKKSVEYTAQKEHPDIKLPKLRSYIAS